MKKILMMGLVAMAAMVSQASYLYWQVTDAQLEWTYTPTGESMTVNLATLYAVDGNGAASEVAKSPLIPGGAGTETYPMPQNPSVLSSDIMADTGSYSFYIELSKWDSSEYPSFDNRVVLAKSETETYASLADKGFIQTTLTKVPAAWTGGTYSAPEPTSGMLLLVGLGLLGLRRRV